FVETFGNPIGGGKYNDTWRNGNFSAPTYAGYAVQAYLRHSNPVTFVRLVGAQHDTPNTSGDSAHEQSAKAGWSTKNAVSNAATGGGSYGLFVIPSGSLGRVATATITFTGGPGLGKKLTIIDTAGTSIEYETANSEDLTSNPPKFTRNGSVTAIAASLAACIADNHGHNGTITTALDAGEITLTQEAKGTDGNTTITDSGLGSTSIVQWSGGADGGTNPLLRIGAVDMSSLSPTQTMSDMLTGSTIEQCADALRNRIYNISFNNSTELNSTIYFCRVNHNDFNYSANPTYLSSSKIRVKENIKDLPVSYITGLGLYSTDNELMAVAKLSEPIKNDPTQEFTFRVRLDY
ncbi:hypothetical protein CMI37_05740, partial [Candidatus Pacearchaeota archaeon]|nr:hypothetical protein [Candidatus Pacearchaeota archaeon]